MGRVELKTIAVHESQSEKRLQYLKGDVSHFPTFCVRDKCDANTGSFNYLFDGCYTNDPGLDGTTIFTRSQIFQVKHVEILEMTA
jgi:hypothetical protein